MMGDGEQHMSTSIRFVLLLENNIHVYANCCSLSPAGEARRVRKNGIRRPSVAAISRCDIRLTRFSRRALENPRQYIMVESRRQATEAHVNAKAYCFLVISVLWL